VGRLMDGDIAWQRRQVKIRRTRETGGARGRAETSGCAATDVDEHAMRDEPLLQWTIQTDAHARSREAAARGRRRR
jgi:hypothetical protein